MTCQTKRNVDVLCNIGHIFIAYFGMDPPLTNSRWCEVAYNVQQQGHHESTGFFVEDQSTPALATKKCVPRT